jgi:hypothetical protein
MIVDPEIVANESSLREFVAAHDIAFFDFGCSAGGGTKRTEGQLGRRGIGFDIDPEKLKLADAAGMTCCEFDLLTLPAAKVVEQTIIFHMLEHLYSVEQARQFIDKAVEVSTDYVVIKQPYYDSDTDLFRMGLKTYYSHWTGHRNQMTTPDFWFILDALRRDGLIKDFVIGYKMPIASSSHPILHPLASRINCHDYDAAVNPPKPMDVVLDFPLYYEIQVEIDIRGLGSGALWAHLAPDAIAYDSRNGEQSRLAYAESVARLKKASYGAARPKAAVAPSIPDVRFFIRDDDFWRMTDKFERLETLARRGASIMLAAIPGELKVTDAECARVLENFTVVQHGFMHFNHAPDNARSEYPETRDSQSVEQELIAGQAILHARFGPLAGKHFVAPWNRFAAKHLHLLTKLGFESYQGLGTIAFHDGLPMIGYGFNFTSEFHACGGDYPRLLAMALQRTAAYAASARQKGHQGTLYVPLNTHHLMMDSVQFEHLERLWDDLQMLHGLPIVPAAEALAAFSAMNTFHKPEMPA